MTTTYTAPGVYIEEQAATGPIQGVGTSTAAFIGYTEKGNIEIPIKITNWSQYKSKFGEYLTEPHRYTAHAVEGFFKNGGTQAYIVKVDPNGANEDEKFKQGLSTLERIDDINFICIPDNTSAPVQQEMITHCQTTMKDRFAILDPTNSDVQNIVAQRAGLNSPGGFAALYFPYLSIANPKADETILVPPSGHIAGIYARSDAQRGVHKAPANESVAGALGIGMQLTEVELGNLNDQGINVIRTFSNQTQPTVWGARTIAGKSATAWQYINVRRLLLYIEESIEEGIRWAVFEPNNQMLWKKLDRRISEFLTRVWRDGALFGSTPEEAFYVKCDEELNTEDVRNLGQVIVEVGVAPVRPAEFVIIRIGQWSGGSKTIES